MKVFYIAQFERGYESCVVHALEQHSVVVRTYPQDYSHALLLNELDREQPDFVLFSKPQPTQTQELLAYCKAQRILTIAWVWDLYWGYRPNRPDQFYADVLLTTDGGHQQQFETHGYNHSVLRQGIHEPQHIFYNRKPLYDVAFVGGSSRSYYKGRRELVAWLEDTYGTRFKQYTDTRGLALNQELAKVKVVVGDSYPSPHYWSNRVYEIIGRGGFLLHPYTDGLDKEFIDGTHYIAYERGNFTNLKQVIDHWVLNDNGRDNIARQGFDYCGENYTYKHRVATLLDIVNNAKGVR